MKRMVTVPGNGSSVLYGAFNRGKPSIALDLKQPGAMRVVRAWMALPARPSRPHASVIGRRGHPPRRTERHTEHPWTSASTMNRT